MVRQLRIRPLLTGTLLVFALLPTLLFGLLIVYFFSAEVSRGYAEHLRTSVAFQARSLTTFFQAQQQQLQAMVNVPMLRELLEVPKEDNPAEYAHRQQHLSRFLASLVDNLDLVRAAQIIDRRNTVLASSRLDEEHLSSTIPVNVASLPPGRIHVTPLCSLPHGERYYPHFSIILPIVDRNAVVGALVCSFDVKAMEPGIRAVSSFDTGNTILFDNKLVTVAGSRPTSTPLPEELTAFLDRAVETGTPREGWINYTFNGAQRIAYYSLLPDIRWGVLGAVNTSEINGTRNTALLWLGIGLLAVSPLLLLVAWLLSRYLMQDIQRILDNIKVFRKGVMPASSRPPLRTELAVINTALRELMEALSRSNEEKLAAERQFRLALEQTHQLVFEVNLSEGRILSGKERWNQVFISVFSPDYEESLRRTISESVHSDDQQAFEHLFSVPSLMAFSQTDAAKADELVMEFRCKKLNGAYRWYSCALHLLRHNDTLRGVVCIKDIHDRKVRELEIEWQARKDSLTGLYNKRATQNAITAILDSSTQQIFHALFVIDLDNFKSVNDTLGHQTGDALLHDFAVLLQSHFRDSDIVGRIGGDEFMVLLKDYRELRLVNQKAGDIIQHSNEFFHAFLAKQQVPNLHLNLGVSIGIALYVRDGDTFAALYKAADTALYKVKKGGKHTFGLYAPTDEGDKTEG